MYNTFSQTDLVRISSRGGIALLAVTPTSRQLQVTCVRNYHSILSIWKWQANTLTWKSEFWEP